MAPFQLELAHVVMLVRDLDVMVGFYTDVLGFEVTDRGASRRPGRELVFLSQSPALHHQIAFVNDRVDDAPANTVDHWAFRMGGTLDDLRALLEALRAHDAVSEVTPVSHGNTWSIYFRDPEGNRVEIYLDTPFHVAQPQRQPFDPDVTDDELMRWTEQTFAAMTGFEPMEQFVARRRARLEPPS